MAVEKTLSDVVAELKANNKATARTNKNLDTLVKLMTKDGDDLETKLDKQRKRKEAGKSGAFKAGQKTGEALANPFRLFNPAKLIMPLLAGITAFGAGIAGLRGWEKIALKNVKSGIGSLGDIATKGANNLKLGLLKRIFGIGANGEKITGLGKKGDLTKVLTVEEAVNNRMQKLKTNFLNMFGIGADGKPISVAGADGKIKGVSGSGAFITSATARINKLLNPIAKVSAGIADFFKGVGAGLFKFLDPFLTGAKGFAKLFSKILWPVGVIMSLFESVTAYQETDGSKFDKFKAGFGTFFADFIGAPLDLLKSGMVWVLKNLLGLESDEDGNIKEGQGLAGDALKIIQNFSFKDAIKGLIDGIFGMGEAAFKWFGDLFSGEKSIGESMSILWKGWLGAQADIASWVWNKAIAPITEWFASKLGIDLELPELDIKKMVGDSYEKIKNNFLNSMENLAIWFMTMPKKIGLALEEEWVYAIQKLKIGFVKFGAWVSGLPDSIFLGSLQKLKETVPNWAAKALKLDNSITNAQARVDARDSGTAAALERIDYDTAKQLGDINQRRRDLDSYSQQLIDAKQYNNTNNNGSLVLQTATPTQDVLNGGSGFGAIGGP